MDKENIELPAEFDRDEPSCPDIAGAIGYGQEFAKKVVESINVKSGDWSRYVESRTAGRRPVSAG